MLELDKCLLESFFHDLFPCANPRQLIADSACLNNSGWGKSSLQQSRGKGIKISEDRMKTCVQNIVATMSSGYRAGRDWTSSLSVQYPIIYSATYRSNLGLPKSGKQAIWEHLDCVVHFKATEPRDEVDCYIQRIVTAQPGRRFVLAASVIEHMMKSWLLRSLSSRPFSVFKEPADSLRLISYYGPEERGHYPSVYEKAGGDGLFIKVGTTEYKVERISSSFNFRRRGTVCYRGEHLVNGKIEEVVIKESSVYFPGFERQLDILDRPNEGDKSVVCICDRTKVMRGKKMLVHVEDFTATSQGVRRERDSNNNPVQTANSEDAVIGNKIEVQRLLRIVMKPCAMPLRKFTSLKDLMKAFTDVAHAIRIAHSNGLVHRDISLNNILLHEYNGNLRSLLFDYYAVPSEQTSLEELGYTGTLPFIAIGRLPKPSHPHSFFHDLESLFYVICWVATLYSGPDCPLRRSKHGYADMGILRWNGSTCEDVHLMPSKKFRSMENYHQLEEKFTPYFEDLKGCLDRLREFVFYPTARGSRLDALKEQLDKRFESAATPEERRDIKSQFNKDLPIRMRPPALVFESFLEILEDAIEGRAEDKTVLEETDTVTADQDKYAATVDSCVTEPTTNDLEVLEDAIEGLAEIKTVLGETTAATVDSCVAESTTDESEILENAIEDQAEGKTVLAEIDAVDQDKHTTVSSFVAEPTTNSDIMCKMDGTTCDCDSKDEQVNSLTEDQPMEILSNDPTPAPLSPKRQLSMDSDCDTPSSKRSKPLETCPS